MHYLSRDSEALRARLPAHTGDVDQAEANRVTRIPGFQQIGDFRRA